MNKFFIVLFVFLLSFSYSYAEIIKDNFIDNSYKNTELQKPLSNTDYNYQSVKKIPIKLKISEKISTKKGGVYDAMPLVFYVQNDVKYNDKILLKKGDKFTAIVETYMDKGMNGIPAIIIIDKFTAKDIDSNKLKGLYIKKGLNLSLMVFPIKWALTPIPGVGSLTNFILGGSACVKPSDVIIIYYYPDWS